MIDKGVSNGDLKHDKCQYVVIYASQHTNKIDLAMKHIRI